MARTRRVTTPWPAIIRELRVARVVDVSATTRRVTLTGEQLDEFEVVGGTAPAFRSEGFDDHVKLLVPFAGKERPPLPVQGPDRLEWGAAEGRPIAKDYTPRRYTDGALDLDFVMHPDGFASGWAERVSAGDLAWIVGPTRSALWPEDIEAMVMTADETALPAVARALEEWPEGRRLPTTIIIEVPTEASVQQLPTPPGVDILWVHGRDAWVAAVEALPWPDGEVFAWAAGESGALRKIRSVLRDHAVPRDLLDVTGYWRA